MPSLGGRGEAMVSISQTSLFNVRVSTKLPAFPNGQDIAFHCIADDGAVYFCKGDHAGRSIRATEWICTKLADHLGLSVADCAVVEDDGDTFFGSRSPQSLADRFELDRVLRSAAVDEVGRPATWLGQMLAQIWAFDLFVSNPDRNLQNFILDRDGQVGQIRAIDFASAPLFPFPLGKFPIASTPTVTIGTLVRTIHGSHKPAAFEILDRIGAVPPSAIESIVSKMPTDWLSQDQMGGICEVWSDGRNQKRVSELKALIRDDW